MHKNFVEKELSKVSIVIPCYNAGQYLEEAIQSALGQTYPNFEIIIVDDGSTDSETLRILAAAKWPRTTIVHQMNAGPAAARNKAIELAAGDYILPLDADDTIEPTYLAQAVSVMEARPDVGVVYCKANKFGDESGPWELPAYSLDELVIDNVIFVTSLFRKCDWQAVDGFNENLRHGVEDYDFWVKIVDLNRVVVQLDGYFFNYRIRAQSRTKTFSEVRANMVDTYAAIFRSNINFYSKNAHHLFAHRFGLYDEISNLRSELNRWQSRYGALDDFIVKHPRLMALLRKFKAFLRRFR